MPAPPLQDGRPTMTVSQRREYLANCRFLEVRHLAYLHYKKPDQTPLMGYEETLDSHERVRGVVLDFEVAQGWLIPDGTEGQAQVPTQPQPQPAAPQGVQPMTQPMPFPPNGAPNNGAPAPVAQAPQQMYAPPPQQMQAPMGAPQQFAPPQQQQLPMGPPQMTMQPPPVASPQQAAGAPPQQEQPAQAPTGRKRKGQGTAVAPPPPAPPPNQAAAPQQFAPPPVAAPPQFAPPQAAPASFAPPQAAPAPFAGPPQQFAPPQGFQPPAPQAPQQAQAPASAQVDLTPVIQRQDALAKMVETLGGEVKSLKTELTVSKQVNLQILTVLHHMYLTHPDLKGNAAGKNTLPEFQAWLQQYIPQSPQ